MGVVPKEKGGAGSAVNDATRVLGATLGVAVIGSVYSSLYASRLTSSRPARLPRLLASAAHDSVGAALSIAGRLDGAGHAGLAADVRAAASGAFFHDRAAAALLRHPPGAAADPLDGRARDAVFCAEVPDVEQAMCRVEALGGSRVLGPHRILGSPEYALFTDPQGVLVGLFNAAGHQ
jgi:hypothetical protein